MNYKNIFVDSSGDVTSVVLNRPEARNAMDETTLQELTQVFTGLSKPGGSKMNGTGQAHQPRVIVVRGAGKDFCAGADIKWMQRASAYSPAKNRQDAKRLMDMLRAVNECPLPVIAKVHGSVYGGALGLISACDIVLAEEKTAFCFSECRLGIIPAVVSTFVLPKIGPGQARRFYLTSEVFGAQKAKDIGLVHEAAPEAELDSMIDQIKVNIFKNSPAALRLTKDYVRRMMGLSYEKRLEYSLGALVKVRSSVEAKEGFAAFVEKRNPSWIQ